MAKLTWTEPKRGKYQLQVKVPERVYKWVTSITKEDVRTWTSLQRGTQTQVDDEVDQLFEQIKAFLSQPARIERGYHVVTETYVPDKKPFNGRMLNGKGTPGMWRPLRSIILGHTTDLDLECSMQRTLLWICKSFQLRAPHLAFYVQNCETVRKQLCDADGISRAKAKQKITRTRTTTCSNCGRPTSGRRSSSGARGLARTTRPTSTARPSLPRSWGR